jgi:hypothetical protein
MDFGAVNDHVARGCDAEADLVNEFNEKTRSGLFHWLRTCDGDQEA